MKKLKLAYILLLLLLCFQLTAEEKDELIIPGWSEAHKFAVKFLATQHIKIEQKSDKTVALTSTQNLYPGLVRLLHILDEKISVCKNNVLNSNTTMDAQTGSVYVRKILTIDEKGNYFIAEDKNSAFRFMYDPTHPDAIKTGPEKGYLKLPNINVADEVTLLIETIYLYNQTVDLLKIINNRFVAEKKDPAEVTILLSLIAPKK